MQLPKCHIVVYFALRKTEVCYTFASCDYIFQVYSLCWIGILFIISNFTDSDESFVFVPARKTTNHVLGCYSRLMRFLHVLNRNYKITLFDYTIDAQKLYRKHGVHFSHGKWRTMAITTFFVLNKSDDMSQKCVLFVSKRLFRTQIDICAFVPHLIPHYSSQE